MRRPVRRRRMAVPALLAALTITACAAEVPSAPQPRGPRSAGATGITITIGKDSYAAILEDNPTARDLAAQLPLTLSFKDFNSVEKIATLPRPLSTEGVPTGADPDINDIGYYSPTNASSSTTATSATGAASSGSAPSRRA